MIKTFDIKSNEVFFSLSRLYFTPSWDGTDAELTSKNSKIAKKPVLLMARTQPNAIMKRKHYNNAIPNKRTFSNNPE